MKKHIKLANEIRTFAHNACGSSYIEDELIKICQSHAPIEKPLPKNVMWLWMNESRPFKFLGLLINSKRLNPEKDNWCLVQDIKSDEIYEVLESDLTDCEIGVIS